MGAYEALPVIFQRTSMLMLAHCIPITLVQLAVPELLRLAGEDPELCRLASAYAIRLLPSLYIEALSRFAPCKMSLSACSPSPHIRMSSSCARPSGNLKNAGLLVSLNFAVIAELIEDALVVLMSSMAE